MPIDTGLFQIVTIVLLLVGLVVGLIVLSSLGKIRRGLAERAQSERPYEPAPSPGPETTSPELERERPVTEAHAPVETGAPTASEQPAAVSATAPDTAATPDREQAAATVGESGTAGGQQQAAAATTTAEQASAEEPQEQPFERDGRWWFRRGSELLVYEEQTGEWVPAPSEATSTASIPAATQSPADFAREEAQSRSTPPAQDGGWKCPSCGAVNGSTAASCRMCFTPRA